MARARAPNEKTTEAGGIHLIPVDGGEPRPITAPRAPRWTAIRPFPRRTPPGVCGMRQQRLCRVRRPCSRAGLGPHTEGALAPPDAAGPFDPRPGLDSRRRIAGLRWSDPRPGAPISGGSGSGATAPPSASRRRGRGCLPRPYLYPRSPGLRADPPRHRRLRFRGGTLARAHRLLLAHGPRPDLFPGRTTHRLLVRAVGRGSGDLARQRGWLQPGAAHSWPGELAGRAELVAGRRPYRFRLAGRGRFLRHLDDRRRRGRAAPPHQRSPERGSSPTWSRDGRWIYFPEEQPEGQDIWRVPGSGGAAERVTRNGGFYAHESPDGRAVFFVRRDDDSPLFSQPLSGGPERQVVDCVVSRSLAVGPDGMYYVGCPPGVREAPLYRLETASGVSRLLGTMAIGGGFVPGMAVSPDGKRVLSQGHGRRRRLDDDRGIPLGLSWRSGAGTGGLPTGAHLRRAGVGPAGGREHHRKGRGRRRARRGGGSVPAARSNRGQGGSIDDRGSRQQERNLLRQGADRVGPALERSRRDPPRAPGAPGLPHERRRRHRERAGDRTRRGDGDVSGRTAPSGPSPSRGRWCDCPRPRASTTWRGFSRARGPRCTAWSSPSGPPRAGGSDPVLDHRARREIQSRARELRLEIEEAVSSNDVSRAERAREELDRITEVLSAALGLRGRSRGLGSTAERARSAVTWRIRSAIRKIESVHPRLGRHLANTVRTGTFCAYRPEAAIHWAL